MFVYYKNSQYKNKETNVECFKRLTVKKIGDVFRVVCETERGFGEGVVTAIVGSIKPYKTEKGAIKALANYEPKKYVPTCYESLVLGGYI